MRFDDPNLVANAGLVLVATLAMRLELEELVNKVVRLGGRVGGPRPGRKVMTLVHAIAAGGSHIDHADVLRSGGTQRVLPFRVMAPSTLGTFLRAFSFGHVRQLEAVVGEVLRRAGGGPGSSRLVVDVDSTICEVEGHNKQGATFGYTRGPLAPSQAHRPVADRRIPQRDPPPVLRDRPDAALRAADHGRRRLHRHHQLHAVVGDVEQLEP